MTKSGGCKLLINTRMLLTFFVTTNQLTYRVFYGKGVLPMSSKNSSSNIVKALIYTVLGIALFPVLILALVYAIVYLC